MCGSKFFLNTVFFRVESEPCCVLRSSHIQCLISPRVRRQVRSPQAYLTQGIYTKYLGKVPGNYGYTALEPTWERTMTTFRTAPGGKSDPPLFGVLVSFPNIAQLLLHCMYVYFLHVLLMHHIAHRPNNRTFIRSRVCLPSQSSSFVFLSSSASVCLLRHLVTSPLRASSLPAHSSHRLANCLVPKKTTGGGRTRFVFDLQHQHQIRCFNSLHREGWAHTRPLELAEWCPRNRINVCGLSSVL